MMTSLNGPAPCGSGCCLTVRAYIEAHLDRVFASDGGARITVEQMQDYLDALRVERAS